MKKYQIIRASSKEELQRMKDSLIKKLHESGILNVEPLKEKVLIEIVDLIRENENPNEDYVVILVCEID